MPIDIVGRGQAVTVLTINKIINLINAFGGQSDVIESTWAAPSGVENIIVTMVSGGAAGNSLGGDGGDGTMMTFAVNVSPGTTYDVQIGQGGTFSGGGNGNGGDTRFGQLAVCYGGRASTNSGKGSRGLSDGTIVGGAASVNGLLSPIGPFYSVRGDHTWRHYGDGGRGGVSPVTPEDGCPGLMLIRW